MSFPFLFSDENARSSTPTCDNAIGWHKGIRSGHFFAAMIPAMRDTLSTSPFLSELLRMRDRGVGFEKYTVPIAMAVRTVCALKETDTMCAEPAGVRCGSVGVDGEIKVSAVVSGLIVPSVLGDV